MFFCPCFRSPIFLHQRRPFRSKPPSPLPLAQSWVIKYYPSIQINHSWCFVIGLVFVVPRETLQIKRNRMKPQKMFYLVPRETMQTKGIRAEPQKMLCKIWFVQDMPILALLEKSEKVKKWKSESWLIFFASRSKKLCCHEKWKFTFSLFLLLRKQQWNHCFRSYLTQPLVASYRPRPCAGHGAGCPVAPPSMHACGAHRGLPRAAAPEPSEQG